MIKAMRKIKEVGFEFIAMHGVTGASWMVPDFYEPWEMEERKELS